jgi:helicase
MCYSVFLTQTGQDRGAAKDAQMKYEFPDNHCLAQNVIDRLSLFDGEVSLTDAQFGALEGGVGRGESLLVVSPTSTGKTLIGLWGIAQNLERGANAVYLVTHRALAQQKMSDFRSQLLNDFLHGDHSSLVLATGDSVKDAAGENCADPLGAKVLVATYEKYLALLSASGIPSDMGNTVIVCDEIQIVADESRGQSVEVLLSLLRRVGWLQFVGLSAVLDTKDAQELSDWLGVKLLLSPAREKHIEYSCHTPSGLITANTGQPGVLVGPIQQAPNILDAISLVKHVVKNEPGSLPLIVFCMTVKDTYSLAELLMGGDVATGQGSLDFDGLPTTFANEFLSKTMSKRIAIHNADLTDDERGVVEARLLSKDLDVVFATTTLAAGVNFPLASAVFSKFSRYNFARKVYVPIDSAEFHNMAGRVGRMGYDGVSGKIFYFAKSQAESIDAQNYLNFGAMSLIKARISPDRFNLLALQLVASGLCATEGQVAELILGTFSAIRELEKNPVAYQRWPEKISLAIDDLVEQGYLLLSDSKQLSATAVGKAVGLSGLTPETCTYLLKYICEKEEALISCLPQSDDVGDVDKLVFLLFSAALNSPEFVPMNGKGVTRNLPWALEKHQLFNADIYKDSLAEKVWRANLKPVNAAHICSNWIKGSQLKDLEGLTPDLRAGAIRSLFRDLGWVLQGLASILTAVVDRRTPVELLPFVVVEAQPDLRKLARLPRVIRRVVTRLTFGLPDNALWLMELNADSEKHKLMREEILAFDAGGYSSPQKLMLGSQEADDFRKKVFVKAKPAPVVKANWLRDAVRDWKTESRKKSSKYHINRAMKLDSVIFFKDYYESLGDYFELAFERLLDHLGIKYVKLDSNKTTGAPDYLISLEGSPDLIFELKSKQGDKLVDYNGATEVLSASEIHGYKDTSCVTLCHPGVDPSVPLAINACARLSVVESHDLAEALLRLRQGYLTQMQLWQWLTTPGQAVSDDLPFVEYD